VELIGALTVFIMVVSWAAAMWLERQAKEIYARLDRIESALANMPEVRSSVRSVHADLLDLSDRVILVQRGLNELEKRGQPK
jgi:hypothetical protein